jgi:hypothetical protein
MRVPLPMQRLKRESNGRNLSMDGDVWCCFPTGFRGITDRGATVK